MACSDTEIKKKIIQPLGTNSVYITIGIEKTKTQNYMSGNEDEFREKG